MFSICVKGMLDFLNLIPGGGMARLTSLRNMVSLTICLLALILTHLQSIVPSFRLSRRSPFGNFSPRISSIQLRTSSAADGVYRDKRSFFMSWSNDETEAMVSGPMVPLPTQPTSVGTGLVFACSGCGAGLTGHPVQDWSVDNLVLFRRSEV
jgi:hypothetical protein